MPRTSRFFSLLCAGALALGVGACTATTRAPGARATHPTAAPNGQAARGEPGPADPPPKSIEGGQAPRAGPGSSGMPRTIALEPMRVEVVRHPHGRDEVVAYDARDLFDQANAALSGKSYDLALSLYDRLTSTFPDSALVPPAMYNAGLALEGKGDSDGAIRRYLDVAARAPGTRDALDAEVRAGAVMTEAGRLREARAQFDKVLARTHLADGDRVELLARRGYAEVEMKDYARAQTSLESAIDLAERVSAEGRHLGTSDFVAMAHYYLGEIPRRQARAVPLRLPDAQLKADLEAKARLVLLAQKRFRATINLGNVYWATAAGYQMAAMQEDLWRALVGAPVPPQLDRTAAAEYASEVRALARPHLDKAFEVYTQTVNLAARLGMQTPWSEAARRRIGEVTRLIDREAGRAPAGGGGPAGSRTGIGVGPDPAAAARAGVRADPERSLPPRPDL